MSHIIIADFLFLVLLILLSIPLGNYIWKVMTEKEVFISPIIKPIETGIYRLMGIPDAEEMNPRGYTFAVIAFSMVGFVFVFLIQLCQNWLPLNPENFQAPAWDLAFNTAASFISNTNWQAYAGETSLSYVTQTLGLCVQNFLSAATGIAVLFALIRGFSENRKTTIGNFWKDLVKVSLYILLPLSLVLAILLVSQGVVQTLGSYVPISTLETGSNQTIPLGPAASQIAIKQLGSNGGGFFGQNSAFPLENPTTFSNFLELLSILLIPAALCVAFGKGVGDVKQGRTIYIVMLVLLVLSLTAITISEEYTAPLFQGVQVAGNLEGKEVIHGVGASALWSAATTAVSSGSVNAMYDSFTPLAGLVLMFLMQLGEVVFGGVGSGLYGMIAFVVLTVFIAGLMVGRTPEYLGKKIEPYDMKMICLIVLIPPVFTLFGTAMAVLMPQAGTWITNSGAHGFSEILYAFSSMANNNGSAFGGFAANTTFANIVGGMIMLVVRFVPMVAVIFLAGNIANKKIVAKTEGTLSTSNAFFIGLLIAIVVLIGALSFLPALALGPIADFFTSLK
jgi:K+-transporting ATPase ATPase A chain